MPIFARNDGTDSHNDSTQPVSQNAQGGGFCMSCGTPLKEEALFCSRCGTPVRQISVEEMQPVSRQDMQQSSTVQDQWDEDEIVLEFQREITDAVGDAVSDRMEEVVEKIDHPVVALLGGAGSFFSGIIRMFTEWKALIFTALLTGIWVWLNQVFVKDDENTLTEVLSVITFARGGTYGTTAGTVGGFLGKGLVAGGFASLLYGGFPRLWQGIRAIFGKGFHIGSFLAGFGASAALYLFMAGNWGLEGIMVGIAGALCAVEALGEKNGFISSLAASLSAKRMPDKSKILDSGKYKSILLGATAGFIVMAAVCGMEVELPDWSWIVALSVALLGLVLSLVLKNREVGA